MGSKRNCLQTAGRLRSHAAPHRGMRYQFMTEAADSDSPRATRPTGDLGYAACHRRHRASLTTALHLADMVGNCCSAPRRAVPRTPICNPTRRYAEAIASCQQHSHPSAVFWTRPTCTASCTASAGDVLVLALGSEIGPAGYTKKPAWDWVPSLSNPLHLTF